MRDNKKCNFFFISASLLFCLWINGSIPFVQAPAFHLFHWEGGWAQSIANNSLLYPYSTNFGLPEPAPISYGLAAVWPMSVFLRLNLLPVDAYTLVNASWLAIAFWGCYSLCRFWGAMSVVASLGAILWLCQPMICSHMRLYGALGLGFALLPTYLYPIFCLFDKELPSKFKFSILLLCFAIISVFMDGYTFMMFFVAGFMICFFNLFGTGNLRNKLFKIVFFLFVIFFSIILYKIYIGALPLLNENKNWFTAFGLDLRFLLIPPRGLLLASDMLGLSESRVFTPFQYWGDASIQFAYSAPITIFGCWAFWKKRNSRAALQLFLIALFAFWMSLGPGLKINELRSGESNIPSANWEGYITTGNWFISLLPGFESMRAAYRWSGLYVFALWGLLVLWLARCKRIFSCSILIVLIFFSLPTSMGKFGILDRSAALKFDKKIISICRKYIHNNELVAVIPRYNDFAINYMSAKTPFRTYNIGGDKNIAMSSRQWPDALRSLPFGTFSSEAILQLFCMNKADVVIVPFFYTVTGWPLREYPQEIKQEWINKLQDLVKKRRIQIELTPYFAVVRPLRSS